MPQGINNSLYTASDDTAALAASKQRLHNAAQTAYMLAQGRGLPNSSELPHHSGTTTLSPLLV